jgi:hypothetical protein
MFGENSWSKVDTHHRDRGRFFRPPNVPGLSSTGRAQRDPRLLQADVGQRPHAISRQYGVIRDLRRSIQRRKPTDRRVADQRRDAE